MTAPVPDGRPVIDYLARDHDSLLQAMRDLIPQVLPEWRDHTNEADVGSVLLELFAHMGDILSYYQDRVADESFLGTARTRRSVIHHLRLIGYQLATAAPAATQLRVSVRASVTDTVTLRRGAAFATRSLRDRPSVRFEYTGDTALTIDFSRVTAVDGRKVVSFDVEEGRLFEDELLGQATRAPDQRFPVAHPGIIRRPPGAQQQASRDIRLTTRLGEEVEDWELRDTLTFSNGRSRHFALEIDEDDQGTVVFGDGVFGAVPPAGADIRITYRTGGGRLGNVPADAIRTIADAPALARLGATVTNPAAATGGAERESIEHAVEHAPAVFRAQERAVTAADYEALALSFEGVGKVKALPVGWNRVQLLVAPAGGGTVSDVLRVGLTGYLEDKRMLGHVVEVEDADPVPILVTAEIGVESYYVQSEVVPAVEAAAARLLAFADVRFGEPVYLSAFYERIQDVPGVRFVNITEFRRADVPDPLLEPSGRILLEPTELPTVPDVGEYSAGLKVVVVGGGG
ncbi:MULTISPECIES: baseplate J/gp47 family protein [unclassified Geodermatophilus]|uniref:baseplate J/gp47 family protein n=1 Tax=unclassified Geodermatophilus TaxID=2637632 RepID=UPI003EEAE29C